MAKPCQTVFCLLFRKTGTGSALVARAKPCLAGHEVPAGGFFSPPLWGAGVSPYVNKVKTVYMWVCVKARSGA